MSFETSLQLTLNHDLVTSVFGALKCLSLVNIISKDAIIFIDELNSLSNFYNIESNEIILKQHRNLHALLNALEFLEGKADPGDHEDHIVFLKGRV